MRFSVLGLVVFTSGSLALQAALHESAGLLLPEGFHAEVVADNLMAKRAKGKERDALRFLAESPDGVLYAKTSRGGVLALSDKDADGQFETVQEFGEGGGTGIAVQNGWLYHSTNDHVFRYKLTPGEAIPQRAPERIVRDLPNEGGHASKAFAFDAEGRLLVEVGSPYNVYSDPDRQFGAKGKDPTEFQKTFGGFWRFDPAKPDQTQKDGFHFSSGHRHILSVAWQPTAKAFYVVMMGRDNLNTVAPEFYDALDNAERVSEEMHRLDEGAYLGWPFTYFDPHKKARMVAPEFGGDNRKRAEAGKYPDPVVAFPAHWAPLQMTFSTGTQFPDAYRGGAFVAFHGSWNRAPLAQDGFNISYAPVGADGKPSGTFEVFAKKAGEGAFRMGGVTVSRDGSLYISETDIGRIWRITWGKPAKEAKPIAVPVAQAAIDPAATAVSAGSPGVAAIPLNKKGETVYLQHCATCHMADGAGAGQLNPALNGSSVVAGDSETLVRTILHGPAVVLPKNRARYANTMPPYPFLTDVQVADLTGYLKARFASQPSEVTPAQVAGWRRNK